ncbi:MAG: tripartite tricarboxylate transporter TctB family protein [Variovorax sp.]|nr:MAG: tripartite tricarboxylate transporter TctB family protein [Variovorax sp.]
MQTQTPAPLYPHAPLPVRLTARAAPPGERESVARGVRIDRNGEFLTGAAVSAFGIALACGAHTVDPGIGGRWGAVYLPLLAGMLIAFAGNLLILKSLSIWRRDAKPARAAVCALLATMGCTTVLATALGGFAGLGLPPIGLLAGIYIVGFIVWLGSEGVRPGTFAALAAALGSGSYVALVVALDLALPVWPTFVVG